MNPRHGAGAPPPDYEREHHAVAVLAQEMADNPRNLLHALVDAALDICDARTAGISLLEDDQLRPHAVAGDRTTALHGAVPLAHPAEGLCLLVPFHDRDTQIGTLWVVAHGEDRKFDIEDERIVGVLATLAAAGWQLWQTSESMAADNRRKDDFLATLAHELRNPLSTIMAATAVLQQRTQPPSAARAIGLISRQTQHMGRLIGDLMDIARIVRGQLELKKERLDLRIVVAQAVDTRRAQIERRSQRLTVDLGEHAAIVDGDPMRLAQVVSNLLDNASKYTPQHGEIAVTVFCNNGDCSVAVRDSGAGIPAEEVERIFQPFAQLPKDGRTGEGGLGLGLALVRTLAELHGGTVTVVSAGAGAGSCFTLRLCVQSVTPSG